MICAMYVHILTSFLLETIVFHLNFGYTGGTTGGIGG
jgi:hypothetical protein